MARGVGRYLRGVELASMDYREVGIEGWDFDTSGVVRYVAVMFMILIL